MGINSRTHAETHDNGLNVTRIRAANVFHCSTDDSGSEYAHKSLDPCDKLGELQLPVVVCQLRVPSRLFRTYSWTACAGLANCRRLT